MLSRWIDYPVHLRKILYGFLIYEFQKLHLVKVYDNHIREDLNPDPYKPWASL